MSLAFASHIQAQIRAGKVPSRGVNLGGWLVAENWINPTDDLWNWDDPNGVQGTGEYFMMKFLGRDKGQALFDAHWSSFITEDDLKLIAAAKFNMVRVPVGYWIQGCNDTYIQQFPDLQAHCGVFPKGGWVYLDNLVRRWAPKYNVAVMVDVHGVPGSQNGAEHSGEGGNSTWSDFPEYVQVTRNFVNYVVDQFKDEPAFLGVDLLNEPSNFVFDGVGGVDFNVMSKYYLDTIQDVRAKSDCILVTEPFLGNQAPGNGFNMEDFALNYINVWHEWHPYLSFSDLNASQFLAAIDDYKQSNLEWTGNPLFLGEWSLATQVDPVNIAKFVQAYIAMIGIAKRGWAAWTWRADSLGVWSMKNTLFFDNEADAIRSDSSRLTFPIYSSADRSLSPGSDWRLVDMPAWIDQLGRSSEQEPWSKRFVAVLEYCNRYSIDQHWQLGNHLIFSRPNNKCLTSSYYLEDCDSSKLTQYFLIGRERSLLFLESQATNVGVTSDNALSFGGSDTWLIDHGTLSLRHETSGKCLEGNGTANTAQLVNCDEFLPYDATTKQFHHSSGNCLSSCASKDCNTAQLTLAKCQEAKEATIATQQFRLVWQNNPDIVMSTANGTIAPGSSGFQPEKRPSASPSVYELSRIAVLLVLVALMNFV
ncbi:exo-1,3-beta-glucanase [Aphanomyces cochlioides]|nr:exo-1,3-beta-glucanase [Aphanomyces cochlioides]